MSAWRPARFQLARLNIDFAVVTKTALNLLGMSILRENTRCQYLSAQAIAAERRSYVYT